MHHFIVKVTLKKSHSETKGNATSVFHKKI